ncbi:methyltransferase domain-containing protein [Kitasatospora sp. NPDC002040]|uniref:class I SAM-dependent methyltransferase n=1 Tax=Kitasatospora sp. NPDC002040 TaxID=3154661 RepID=UPI00332DE01E
MTSDRRRAEARSQYVHAVGEEAAERLAIAGEIYLPATTGLLRRAALAPGMRVADIGCGTGNVTRWIADIVGPSGFVLGVDCSAAQLLVAQAQPTASTPPRYRQADVRDLSALPHDFDLVLARCLLLHLEDPAAAVRQMASLLRPGGVLCSLEPHVPTWSSHPAHGAFTRHVDLYRELLRLRGGQPDLAPTVPGLFREAALTQITINVAQPLLVSARHRAHPALTTRECGPSYLAAGLIDEPSLAELVRGLESFADDDADTTLCAGLAFQATGTKA